MLDGCDEALVARSLQWLELPDCSLVTLESPDYPRYLREIPNAPPVLYAMGRRELLQADMLAIVGSRNPTVQGQNNAMAFGRAISDAGLTVVSGMALGIDAHAHQGGLQGQASSVAVVGTGMDRVYPARHHDLARTLASKGLMLSEFPLGTAPLPGNFPRRNRIISGLSRGCLVVEAALNSGSLVTARLAAAQGRDVFAIPGSIHSPLSRGCHGLIKEGAKLVECTDDILQELQWHPSPAVAESPMYPPAQPDSPTSQPLLSAMGYEPISLEQMLTLCDMTPATLAASLSRLEIEGHVVMLPGGLYQRVI